jgi:uncharacterized protein YuzE
VRYTYDADADAAYISFVDQISPGEVRSTRICDVEFVHGSIAFDLDEQGRLLGIEILGVSQVLPGRAKIGIVPEVDL